MAFGNCTGSPCCQCKAWLYKMQCDLLYTQYALWDISDCLIVLCSMPFSTVFQLYCGSQCTYPCFPGVLLGYILEKSYMYRKIAITMHYVLFLELKMSIMFILCSMC